jgi:hypothetical protein
MKRLIDEMVIHMKKDGSIVVEENRDGVFTSKYMTPEDIARCIGKGILQSGIDSGILPDNCVWYREEMDGTRKVIIRFPAQVMDITYHGTVYTIPVPNIAFGFAVSTDGRIMKCKLAVIEEGPVRMESKLYYYPFSNVNQGSFDICLGSNQLPVIKELRLLTTIPYWIMSLPNNDHDFNAKNNSQGLGYREILKYLSAVELNNVYSCMVESGKTLREMIQIL